MSAFIFQKSKGFTIVELLIVIVVIGILAAITIVAYNGIQVRARDTDRVSDIGQIRKKLEVYRAFNDSYPAAYDMSSSSFRATSLDIPNDSMVLPPGGTPQITYCLPSSPNNYCYSGTTSAGDCVTAGTACTGYWLKYRTEANPSTTITLTNP
jgi:general secretion pathway protein G